MKRALAGNWKDNETKELLVSYTKETLSLKMSGPRCYLPFHPIIFAHLCKDHGLKCCFEFGGFMFAFLPLHQKSANPTLLRIILRLVHVCNSGFMCLKFLVTSLPDERVNSLYVAHFYYSPISGNIKSSSASSK